jgi:hypothetical protein
VMNDSEIRFIFSYRDAMPYNNGMQCTLLHKLILQKMSRDPMESEEQSVADSIEITEGEVSEPEFIMGVSTTNAWTTFQDSCTRDV